MSTKIICNILFPSVDMNKILSEKCTCSYLLAYQLSLNFNAPGEQIDFMFIMFSVRSQMSLSQPRNNSNSSTMMSRRHSQ